MDDAIPQQAQNRPPVSLSISAAYLIVSGCIGLVILIVGFWHLSPEFASKSIIFKMSIIHQSRSH